MSKVWVNYFFLFDPSETWSHVNEFESSLAKFFEQLGLQAELAEGQSNTKVLLISKATPKVLEELPQPQKKEETKSSQKKLQLEKKRRGYDGKFI